jgi:hypothetical protein
LRDYLSTELVFSVRDAQDRASATPIENQVRLLDQMANIGARIMAGHGMMSVAEEGFAIFGRYAGRTQTTSNGVPTWIRTHPRPISRRASCHAVLFMVRIRRPR